MFRISAAAVPAVRLMNLNAPHFNTYVQVFSATGIKDISFEASRYS